MHRLWPLQQHPRMWRRPTLLLVPELQHFRCGGEYTFCSDIRLGLRSYSLERGGGGRPFFCSCYLSMVVPRHLAT
ncbi:MAG: hypothetical protein ACK56F_01450, partial [bacterium]